MSVCVCTPFLTILPVIIVSLPSEAQKKERTAFWILHFKLQAWKTWCKKFGIVVDHDWRRLQLVIPGLTGEKDLLM